jgi:predicted transcriptional regulator
MLETIEEIGKDAVSQRILKLLANGWMPLKTLIVNLNVDRHTAYRRFYALEKHNLIVRSKRQHRASKYKIFGFDLTEIGKILVQENKTVPSISLKYSIHSFEHNYIVNAKLFMYPESKTFMFSSDRRAEYLLGRGIFNMLLELTRDPDIHMVLGNCRLILDCKFESIAEMDVYEFYRECLSPSLESYIKDRTFSREKDLARRFLESPNTALDLIKLTRFTAANYSSKIGKENIKLINSALDVALEEVKAKSTGWEDKISPLIINAYLFMLASIYHLEGKLPEPEVYFELWFMGIYNLKKLKTLYFPLLKNLQERVTGN